jgi:hypothetical protein
MMDITELIEDHGESIFLDFKREPYHAENKQELIRDVLAFANAAYTGDRYIIIGVVKDHKNLEIVPVDKPEDPATIQQYIHDNITPELIVSYTPYDYKGNNVMLLTISDTKQQPYFPSKLITRGNKPFLRENDLWIRKGEHKVLGKREDLEKIYSRRAAKPSLEGKIDLSFKNGAHQLAIPVIKDLEWPSVVNKNEIQQEIAEKEELVRTNSKAYQAKYGGYYPGGHGTSYQAMDLSALRSSLETVDRNFADEDQYYLHEQRAFHLQLTINNSGNEHLKDVLIQLAFPDVPGFTVADHIYLNTYQRSVATGIDHQAGYPKVRRKDQDVIVSVTIGEVRHRVPDDIFIKPLRIVPTAELVGQEIKVQATVYASNLPNPQHSELSISFK